MYRSGSRYQEWSVSGHVSVAAPVRLPKFVRSRSAQYRLKTYGPSKPTAIIKPFPAFSAASSEVWEKLGVVKTEFEWSSLVSKEIRKHDKKERIPEVQYTKKIFYHKTVECKKGLMSVNPNCRKR